MLFFFAALHKLRTGGRGCQKSIGKNYFVNSIPSSGTDDNEIIQFSGYFRIKFRSRARVPSQRNEPIWIPAPTLNYPQFESHFLAFMNSLDTNAAYRLENTKVFLPQWNVECMKKKLFSEQFRLLDSLQSFWSSVDSCFCCFCRFASPLCAHHCTWSTRKLNKSWNRCLFCRLTTLIESLWQLNWVFPKDSRVKALLCVPANKERRKIVKVVITVKRLVSHGLFNWFRWFRGFRPSFIAYHTGCPG